MLKITVNKVARATILALGTAAAGLAFAATPVSEGTYTTISQSNSPREDISALQYRANQMDELINNNESAVLTSDPSLGTQWMNRIVVSGKLNVDARASERSYVSNNNLNGLINATSLFGPNPNYGSTFGNKWSSGLDLNDSEIDIDAQINCWVKAHVALMGEDNNSFPRTFTSRAVSPIGGFSAGFNANTLQPDEQKFTTSDRWLDEAYITLGDFTQTPFFFTAGREYVPFGHYVKNELTPDLTTYLTETQATAADLGFVTPFFGASNIYGSIYALDGLNQSTGPTIVGVFPNVFTKANQIGNFGADLGVDKKDKHLGYNAGVSFLDNMADVNTITNVISGFGMGISGFSNISGGYQHNVPAISAHAGMNYGPFNVEANGVTALQHFSSDDLAWTNNGVFNTGAMPWAVDAKVGYNFSTIGHDSQAYFRYGHSGEAVALALPENRYLVGYDIDLAKNTTMEFQVMYNSDYSTEHGGTGDGDVEGAMRLSVVL